MSAPKRRGDAPAADPAFLSDVLAGLEQTHKAIPARWFYDHRGSQLFEEITKLPEYYPTRIETGLLEKHGGEVSGITRAGRAVVEFGSGSSLKTPHLLRAIHPAAYVPIDISGDFLRESARTLAADFPDIAVSPVEGDFTRPIRLPESVARLPKLGFFPGSTIGNLRAADAVDLLRSMRASLGTGALLLIGIDRIKAVEVLIPAYDDAAGVTAFTTSASKCGETARHSSTLRSSNERPAFNRLRTSAPTIACASRNGTRFATR